MNSTFDDDYLFNNARKAYFRRFGASAKQPANSSGIEQIDGQEYFVLRNINGPIAKYKILNGARLRFCKLANS